MSLAAVEFLQAFDLHVSHSALAKWRIHMASCVCVYACDWGRLVVRLCRGKTARV